VDAAKFAEAVRSVKIRDPVGTVSMNPYVVEETFLLDELARRAKQVLLLLYSRYRS